MDIIIQNRTTQIDVIKLQKMAFIYNALEKGWTIKKKNTHYIFTKKHSGQKEVYLESYLRRFMVENFDIENLLMEKK